MSEPTIRPPSEGEPAGETARPAPPPLGNADTRAAAGSPVSPGEEFLARARTARDHHGGHPPARWSTGEQAAVALLLGSRPTLQRLEMSPQQACLRLADDLGLDPREAATWVEHQRQALTTR